MTTILRRFPEVNGELKVRRSARIAAKNAAKPAAKPLSPVILELQNKLEQMDKISMENIVYRICEISNILEFMYDDRLRNIYAKYTTFREEVKNKINELDKDITFRVIPYWLAMKYHEASKNLRKYIEEIEKTL
jgi:hypothetical protein